MPENTILCNRDVYTPVFFRLNNVENRREFEELISSGRVIIYDEILGQLRELIKCLNPQKKLSDSQYSELINEHLNETPLEEYGVWVYYPWSMNLVHILDDSEFAFLRTAANRNKITTEEQRLLSTKKVGVIGLSVGQSVSVTMAMERSFGEIRLADFDTIELNNLNRIRTGLHNLGLKKVIKVAREIAEIDPFIKVSIYPDGINDENIHDFFTEGGKLDIVIDECDSVNIKILTRIKAKELNVPVLMEASDRGTLDVERFDLELNRPIIHGWLEHLDIDMEKLKQLKTSEERLPYILPISGLETLSPRMKASMIEIEQTITTWPQLASAVALGGALTADTCRRIFLNQFTNSGRYFIDLESLIPEIEKNNSAASPLIPELTKDAMVEMASRCMGSLPTSELKVSDNQIARLVEAAIKAPSAGNNQPWKWHFQNSILFLFHDKARSASFGDFEDMASMVGLGTAIENLELEANNLNIGTHVTLFPVDDLKQLIAAVHFSEKASASLYKPEELVKYIDTRCTNRFPGLKQSIPAQSLDLLKDSVASVDGAALTIVDCPQKIEMLGDIIAASERLRLLHPEGHFEFFNKELRWNDEQSKSSRDGIDINTVDISPSDIVGMRLMQDPKVANLLSTWNAGKRLEGLGKKAINSSTAVGIITMPEFSSTNQVLGGRAVERMWLTATGLNISIHPMLASVLHFARLIHADGEGMPDFMKKEFEELYQRYQNCFPEITNRSEVFLFRISISNPPKVRSYRLPLDRFMTIE